MSSRSGRRPVWFGGAVLAVVLPVALLTSLDRPEAGPAAGRPELPGSCLAAPLPTLGGLFGQAVAANQRGVAVGTATDAAEVSHAVRWQAGRVRRLSTGTTGSIAVGVNGRGDVIGIGRVDATPVGWVWSRGAAVRLAAGPGEVAVPAAVNEQGVIVGALAEDVTVEEGSGDSEAHEDAAAGHAESEQAAVWRSPAAEPTVLPPLPGDEGGHALAVDDRGRIGGFSAGARFRPVIWEAGRGPRPLADLGGGYAAVRGLANSGLAVGDAVSADGTHHPVTWDAAGRISRLELPAGARSGQALAVLADATVVGTVDVPVAGGGRQQQAVRWAARRAASLLSATDGRTGSAVGGAVDGATYAGHRTDAVGGRHPVLWRCGR